jgi:hypothetical protein
MSVTPARWHPASPPCACLCLACAGAPPVPFLQGAGQLSWVIAANEEMARFMILADACLADQDKVREEGGGDQPASRYIVCAQDCLLQRAFSWLCTVQSTVRCSQLRCRVAVLH